MASGPAGLLVHPLGVLAPRRESHGRDHLRSSLRPLLLPPRLPGRYPSHPAATAPSLREHPFEDFHNLPDVPFATTADLDVLGATAEFQLGDSAGRYSNADWAREQQVEPACHAAMRYIVRDRPQSLPADFSSCFPLHQRSSFSEIQELAGKDQLHTTDDGIVLLVLKPIP